MNRILEISKELEGTYSVSKRGSVHSPQGTLKEEIHCFAIHYSGSTIRVLGCFQVGADLGVNCDQPPYSIHIKTSIKSAISIYPLSKVGRVISRIFKPALPTLEKNYDFSRNPVSRRLRRNKSIAGFLLNQPVSILSPPESGRFEILAHTQHLTKEQLLELISLSKEILDEIG